MTSLPNPRRADERRDPQPASGAVLRLERMLAAKGIDPDRPLADADQPSTALELADRRIPRATASPKPTTRRSPPGSSRSPWPADPAPAAPRASPRGPRS
ncbi:hypothetical protein ACFQ2M_23425 [Kitasatospora saccharophila]|uniref:hypothetical protein n=1 Tax=Kitasatospora saccharophila TaxID=407973 RepID=UPI0036383CF7